MIWSGSRRIGGPAPVAVLLAALAASGTAVAADDDTVTEFDRPGIGFGADVLKAGAMAWEQGGPSITRDRQDGAQSTLYTLDSLLRLGLGGHLELQLGADSYNWVRGDVRARGGGDASAGLKLTLPSVDEDFSWALLGRYTLPTGAPAFSQGGYSRQLGVSASWDLGAGRSLALYANYAQGDEGHTWTFSPSYTFYSDERFSGYVEAGYAHGVDPSRVAGGGMTWRVLRNVQLDISALRGLDSQSPDWQGGVGIAVAFR